jgi:hypothetical protein
MLYSVIINDLTCHVLCVTAAPTTRIQCATWKTSLDQMHTAKSIKLVEIHHIMPVPHHVQVIKPFKLPCKIISSFTSDYEEYCLLECDAMQSGRYLATFQRNPLLPSFGIYIYIYTHTHTHTHTHTGCPRRNVPGFRRVFLMLKYAYAPMSKVEWLWR